MKDALDSQDKHDLLFAAKSWPHTFGSKLASLLNAPFELRAAIVLAEIGLLEAAKEQRDAITALEEWLRQQEQEEQQ
jgi:hypothetical protein